MINRSDFDLHITTFLHNMHCGAKYFRKKKLDSDDQYKFRVSILKDQKYFLKHFLKNSTYSYFTGDYDVKPCHGSHCPPCRSHYPSCIGRPDGLSPWQGRELTHHYVICSFERAIFRGVCTNSRIFNPTKLKCVNSDQVKTTLNKISEIV